MDTSTTRSKTASLPATYQCIVCQMTTVSLSKLHRHQTYQHTPEELSLSTIGLQCLLINNIHGTNSIVYDNSWLCNPLKQAEFYTVSAKLLNDCNGSVDDSAPVDYALGKEYNVFKEEDDANEPAGSKSFAESKPRVFDLGIDCVFPPAAGLASQSLENVVRNVESQDMFLEANSNSESLKKALQVVELATIGKGEDQTFRCPEKTVPVEESVTIGKGEYPTFECAEKTVPVEESVTIGKGEYPTFECPEKTVPLEESVTIGKEADRTSESLEKELRVEESEAIGKWEDPTLECSEKAVRVEESVTIGKEAERTFESPEVNVTKPRDSKNVSKFAEKYIKTETSDVVASEANDAPVFTEKYVKREEFEIGDTEADPFVNCVEGLCSDLERMKKKPKKRKITPARNPPSRRAKAEGKPRAPRKRAKTCDTALNNNTIMQKADKATKNSARKDFTRVDCTECRSKIPETENPVDQYFPNKDIDVGRSEITEIKVESQETEIVAMKNLNKIVIADQEDLANGNFAREELESRNVEVAAWQDFPDENTVAIESAIVEQEIPVEEDFAVANPAEMKSKMVEQEIPIEENFAVANPAEIKSEMVEQEIPFEENFANINCPENSALRKDPGAPNPPTAFTFPWYPPDINEYSILVLDPEAHQLVWSEVAIVEAANEIQSETTREIPILRELTESDIRNSEIAERSSSSRVKESAGSSSPQSRAKEDAAEEGTKPRTNFVLRPRRAAANRAP